MEREGTCWRARETDAALSDRESNHPVLHPRLGRWVSQYCSWGLLGEKTRQAAFETVSHMVSNFEPQGDLPHFKGRTLVSSMLVFLTRRCT